VKGIGSKTIESIKEMVSEEKENPYISRFNPNIELLPNNIYHGDCLELMNGIKDKGIDMILCDLPYGTTACRWDEIIPFDKLWLQYERIIKDNGAIVLFGSEPFSTKLRMSKLDWYKYDWIWEKSNPSNIALANKQPMRYHELISIFYKKQPTYNKQMIHRKSKRIKQAHESNYIFKNVQSEQINLNYIEVDSKKYDANYKNPSTVLKFNSLRPNAKEFVKHPTQKPIALCEYLIKTYTNENDLVLDNCIGSGTTAVACINTNRKYMGIELNKNYYDIAVERIKKHMG
jgi:DNA modification methylase